MYERRRLDQNKKSPAMVNMSDIPEGMGEGESCRIRSILSNLWFQTSRMVLDRMATIDVGEKIREV